MQLTSRLLFSFLALGALITHVAFGGSSQPSKDTPITAVVSIPPQRYFLEQIGGNHLKILVMVPKGFEPEDYEPKPQQLKSLSKAKLYFTIGVPFEENWIPKFKAVNQHLKFIHTENAVQKIQLPSQHYKKFMHRQAIKDPHIWLSPTLVRLQAIMIRDALIQQDPQHAKDYRENYLNFASIINQVDKDILAIFSQKRLQGKDNFFIFHPAWGYFSRDYGLKQTAIEQGGKSPTMKQLAKLTQKAKLDKINTIFVSPEFSKKSAQAIASSINARIEILDPLSEQWDKNLTHAAQAIAASFND